MNIAQLAVSKPVAMMMRVVALVFLGAICLARLPVDLLPNVSLPTVMVSTSWPDVAPEEMESTITRPIEESLSSVANLYQINSTSQEGSSSVRVQFQWGTDIGRAAVDVMQLLERAKTRFPNDPTLVMPTVFKFDPTQTPILIYGISGENDPVKLRTLLDNQVTPIIESANGVASATATGGLQRSILVDIDPVRLQAHHYSVNDVIKRLVNENLNVPAGIAKQSDTEYTVRTLGWFGSPQEISSLPMGSYNGQVVTIGDVATVKDSHTEQRMYSRLNQQPAAGMIIIQQSGANTIDTYNAVKTRVNNQIKKMYPNLVFREAYNQANYIQNSMNDVKISAVIGGVLAVLILLFFLRNVRSTLVVALSIPTSIISTFALMYLCGFTLNTMSMGGLALATGLIVDDAVVVLENIFRHIERDKKSAREAAVTGTQEIMSAVFASTWTVMVVFLPLLMIKGQAGQMFAQFALVIIFSMAISLMDALITVPLLASRLISGDAHAENLANAATHPNLLNRMFHRAGEWFDSLDHGYRRALDWAIHHRLAIICAALAITLSSLLLVPMLGTELMPQTDSGNISVDIKMPPGTSVAHTNETMKKIEAICMKNDSVETAFAVAGSSLSMRGSSTTLTPYRGGMTIRLKDNRREATRDVITDLRKQISRLPGVRAQLSVYDIVSTLMTGGNNTVEVDIFGQNLSTLSDKGNEVVGLLGGGKIAGFENVDVNWQEAMPEIRWQVDRQKAAQLGVSFADIANTLNTTTNGNLATYFQDNGFQFPITVEYPPQQMKTINQMAGLMITPSMAGFAKDGIILSQVAHPIYANGPSQITRQDRQRYIAVSGTPMGRSSGEIQTEIQKMLADLKLPQGYYWDWGTNQKRQAEQFSGMYLAIFLAIGLIYMLLASQFESLIHPFTVLMSVPLAITGVILALFLTGRSFGITALIGVLMLVGIVVKNGILLVDYTNVLRKTGLKRDDAVLRAGPTRLRPILMTASAAILGMLPIASGLGRGSEINAPMATAVIGGLMTSTFLTLFVIPVVYTLFDDLADKLRRRRQNGQVSVDSTVGSARDAASTDSTPAV